MTRAQQQVRNQYAWKTINKNSRSRSFWMHRESQSSKTNVIKHVSPTKRSAKD